MKQKQSASKNQKQKETRAHTITVLRGVRLPSQHTCSSVPSLIFRRSFPQLIQQSFGRRKTARSASHFWLAGSRLAGPVCSGKQRGSHRGNGAAPGGSWPRGETGLLWDSCVGAPLGRCRYRALHLLLALARRYTPAQICERGLQTRRKALKSKCRPLNPANALLFAGPSLTSLAQEKYCLGHRTLV